MDQLKGLKENVIIGHLIPAGTGMPEYRQIDVFQEQLGDLEAVEEEETKPAEEGAAENTAKTEAPAKEISPE